MTTAALTAPSPLWYLTRGTGAVALVLLTASVVLGVTSSARWTRPGWPRFVVGTVHRNVSLLVVVLLCVHIVTAVVDPFAGVRLVDAVLPFVSRYRPLWVGLGAVAFDLLLAVIATSLLRHRLGHRAWKAVHWAAYGLWPVALVHGLGTGTDVNAGWLLAVAALCLVAVVLAVWWRVAEGWPDPQRTRVAALGASLMTPVAIFAFVALGPLAPRWARRAGTPASILSPVSARGAGAPTTSAGAADRAARPLPNGSFAAPLAGTVSQSPPDPGGQVTIEIVGRLEGPDEGSLRILLRGTPLEGGGVGLVSSRVILRRAGKSSRGHVRTLQGDRLGSLVSDSAGHRLALDVRLALNGQAGTVSGTVEGHAIP